MTCDHKVGIENLIGLTITKIEGGTATDALRFFSKDGDVYVMHHHQDCCENVRIEDINGELADLTYTPIFEASARTSSDPKFDPPLDPSDAKYGSYTWTFYRISTIRGTVVIRWYGASNGYYGEEVDFHKETKDDFCRRELFAQKKEKR